MLARLEHVIEKLIEALTIIRAKHDGAAIDLLPQPTGRTHTRYMQEILIPALIVQRQRHHAAGIPLRRRRWEIEALHLLLVWIAPVRMPSIDT